MFAMGKAPTEAGEGKCVLVPLQGGVCDSQTWQCDFFVNEQRSLAFTLLGGRKNTLPQGLAYGREFQTPCLHAELPGSSRILDLVSI